MSKFLQIVELEISDQDLLVQSLAEDMEYWTGAVGCTVESHATPVHLLGYQGDQRPETAEVVIRREFVGEASNDIGFRRQKNGNFRPIISEFDVDYYNASWLDQLSQKYAERKYIREMRENGYLLSTKTTLSDGSTEMSFTAQALL